MGLMRDGAQAGSVLRAMKLAIVHNKTVVNGLALPTFCTISPTIIIPLMHNGAQSGESKVTQSKLYTIRTVR